MLILQYSPLKILINTAFILLVFGCCTKSANNAANERPFADTPLSVIIKSGQVDEASGIADSKSHPGFLWVEQDSGNPTDLFLLSYSGSILKKVHGRGMQNRDWEDMATGSGPDANKNYLYVADIGDNNLQYNNYAIYRFEEPAVSTDTVNAWEKIMFRYPDGSHDAEAILLDNDTKDLYIITKRDVRSKLFKLAYSQRISDTLTASLMAELPFTGAVGAALSSDGREIIIKTYTALYYWKREQGEAIQSMLQKSPVTLSYNIEPQGEAICFNTQNSGFYTLSERPAQVNAVELNFYKRR